MPDEIPKDILSPLLYLESTSSTNDAILSHFYSPHCAVYTYRQLQGRGNYGKKWQTPPDDALAYSFGLLYSYVPDSQFMEMLNFYTAIVVSDFLENHLSVPVQIKWPNDIIINQKKVGGILLETAKEKQAGDKILVFGIGINVNQDRNLLISQATSIKEITGTELNKKEFTDKFHLYFSKHIVSIPDSVTVLSLLEKKLFAKNKWMSFSTSSESFQGKILGISPEGSLIIEKNDLLSNTKKIQLFSRNSLKMHY